MPRAFALIAGASFSVFWNYLRRTHCPDMRKSVHIEGLCGLRLFPCCTRAADLGINYYWSGPEYGFTETTDVGSLSFVGLFLLTFRYFDYPLSPSIVSFFDGSDSIDFGLDLAAGGWVLQGVGGWPDKLNCDIYF